MIARFLLKLAAMTSMVTPVTGTALAQSDASVHIPPHERVVLSNGVTLIIVPQRDVPLIACNALLRGGELGDLAGKPGVASLVAGLLEKGAGERDAFQFADAVEGVGGSFGASAGPESITIRGQFLARLEIALQATDRHLLVALQADRGP